MALVEQKEQVFAASLSGRAITVELRTPFGFTHGVFPVQIIG